MKLTKGSMKNKQKAFPKEHGKTNLISKLHSSSSPSLTHLLLSSHSLTLSRQKQPTMTTTTTTIWRKHIFTQWKSLMCTFQCSLLLYICVCMKQLLPSLRLITIKTLWFSALLHFTMSFMLLPFYYFFSPIHFLYYFTFFSTTTLPLLLLVSSTLLRLCL